MSTPRILDQPTDTVLGCMGIALLQVKTSRNLTLPEIGRVIVRSRQQVAKYIAGEEEMGAVAWERAKAKWPELADRFREQLELIERR